MTPQPVEQANAGQISHFPFLYYYILGRIIDPIYDLSSNTWVHLFSLRFMNNLISIASIASVWWLANQLTKQKLIALTTVIAYSQTTMVFFIGSGVNYDNAVALFAFISCALTSQLVKQWDVDKFLWLNITLQIGSLSKLSVLPLYIACILILAIVYRKTLIEKTLSIFDARRSVLFVFAMFTMVTTFFYGRNLLEFRSPSPSCDQVINHEACLTYPVYARNFNLLENDNRPRELTPVAYFPAWVEGMSARLYTFMGHQRLTENPISPQLAGLMMGFMLLTATVSIFVGSKNQRSLAFVAIFYALFLCYYFNYYSAYQKYGIFNLALQGRYLMPILPLLYFFAANTIYHLLKRDSWSYIVGITPILLIIIHFGYLAVLRDANPDWANAWILPIIVEIV